MSGAVEQKIDHMNNNVDELKDEFSSLNLTLQKLAETMAVSLEKHDQTDRRISESKIEIKELRGELKKAQESGRKENLILRDKCAIMDAEIKAIKPVAEAIRGAVWKFAIALILGSTSISAIIGALVKSLS